MEYSFKWKLEINESKEMYRTYGTQIYPISNIPGLKSAAITWAEPPALTFRLKITATQEIIKQE